MLITLQRTRENHISTVGTLTGGFFTLEDGFRSPKVHGETRIPPGMYRLKLRTDGGMHGRYLERFGAKFHHGMIWLQDVPDFVFVYVHIGNTPTESDGCILIGSHAIAPTKPTDPFRVSESEKAYRAWYPAVAAAILNGEDCFLEVRDRDEALIV